MRHWRPDTRRLVAHSSPPEPLVRMGWRRVVECVGFLREFFMFRVILGNGPLATRHPTLRRPLVAAGALGTHGLASGRRVRRVFCVSFLYSGQFWGMGPGDPDTRRFVAHSSPPEPLIRMGWRRVVGCVGFFREFFLCVRREDLRKDRLPAAMSMANTTQYIKIKLTGYLNWPHWA